MHFLAIYTTGSYKLIYLPLRLGSSIPSAVADLQARENTCVKIVLC